MGPKRLWLYGNHGSNFHVHSKNSHWVVLNKQQQSCDEMEVMPFPMVLECHTEVSTVTVQYAFLLEFLHGSVQWMSVATAPTLYSPSPLSWDSGRTVFMHVTHENAHIFRRCCSFWTNHFQAQHTDSVSEAVNGNFTFTFHQAHIKILRFYVALLIGKQAHTIKYNDKAFSGLFKRDSSPLNQKYMFPITCGAISWSWYCHVVVAVAFL